MTPVTRVAANWSVGAAGNLLAAFGVVVHNINLVIATIAGVCGLVLTVISVLNGLDARADAKERRAARMRREANRERRTQAANE